jgi:hypothetical protein
MADQDDFESDLDTNDEGGFGQEDKIIADMARAQDPNRARLVKLAGVAVGALVLIFVGVKVIGLFSGGSQQAPVQATAPAPIPGAMSYAQEGMPQAQNMQPTAQQMPPSQGDDAIPRVPQVGDAGLPPMLGDDGADAANPFAPPSNEPAEPAADFQSSQDQELTTPAMPQTQDVSVDDLLSGQNAATAPNESAPSTPAPVAGMPPADTNNPLAPPAPAAQTQQADNTPVQTQPVAPAAAAADAVTQENAALQARVTSLEEKIAQLQQDIADMKAARTAAAPAPHKEEAKPEKKAEKSPAKPASKKAVAAKAAKPAAPAATWVLRAAKEGTAWVSEKGSNELKSIKTGDTLSGIGRVTSIAQDDAGMWVVTGTLGKINQ